MPAPSGWGTSVVLNNKIYVFGGATDDRTHVDLLQIYDPMTDQWDLSKARPIYLRYGNGACAVNGKIYLLGGETNEPSSNADILC